MKSVKKALSVFLCALMLVTSFINEGWSSLFELPEASAMAGHEQNYNDTRVELDFNKNWSFGFTDDDAAYLKGYDDSAWEKVDLPHDFSMSQEFTTDGTEAESGNLPGGTGWYRKWFNLYEYYSGDRVILNFDGAYQHAYVYVNGKYVGENHYGYNSFSFEIADYLICSNTVLNLIAVKVVNDVPSSRWYSGSGINRDVTLTIAGSVHVSLYGPRITTPYINSEDGLTATDGTIEASVKIHNCTAIAKKVTVEASILDSEHNEVSGTVSSKVITVDGNAEESVVLSPSINSPKLWSTDSPNLYVLRTVVKDDAGEPIDEYHTTFGYRSVEWDAEKGFSLNGTFMKLKGVCLHHDQGALGAVQEYESLYRQLMILKDMGCNAIRTSHNSTSKILINICNEIGMLVIEEFFDGWDVSKDNNTYDFSTYFNESLTADNKAIGANGQKWYEYVIEHTIYRDEHDPCVIAWDIGNELYNITEDTTKTKEEQTENYEAIVNSIKTICKTLDPSRAILQGNNAPANETLAMIDSKMDVVGGNYSPNYWAWQLKENGDTRGNMPFVATEAASALSCRGVYNLMVKQPDDETEAPRDEENFQITSYDTDWVSWGNSAAEAWYYVATNDWFSGEFIWTGFDYIGEPTPWNDLVNPNENSVPNSSYFGVVDTAGFEKDSYYLYRSLWNEESTTLHLVPGTWNSDNLAIENGYVNVAVYSNAQKIELLLNGQVIGTATHEVRASDGGLYTYRVWSETATDSTKCNTTEFYTDNGKDFYSQFKVKYVAGELSVKAYDENGAEITKTVGTDKVVSGYATNIAVSAWNDRSKYIADGADFIYVEFEAQDENGNFINDYNGTLSIKVDDTSARYAKIVGVDNGNPATTEKFQQASVIAENAASAEIQMYNGKALVILKTTEEEGTINLTAVGNDGTKEISTQGITVTSVKETGADLTDELEEVVKQNGNKYEVTLYDEYEIVKHHINNLEPPVGGGSGDSGDAEEPETPAEPVQDKFEIYLVESNVSDGCIADGDYVINSKELVLSDGQYLDWDMINAEKAIFEAEQAPDGSAYKYECFLTNDDNVFTFTHQGNNKYYIQNKVTGEYVFRDIWKLKYSNTPYAFTVQANNDGSIIIGADSYYICGSVWNDYFELKQSISDDSIIWLYSSPEIVDSPQAPADSDIYKIYLASDENAAQGCIPDGYYVVNNDVLIMTGETYSYWNVLIAEKPGSNVVASSQGALYDYESFAAEDINAFEFRHQGNDIYYIKNVETGKYFQIAKSSAVLTDVPQPYKVKVHDDGSVSIINLNDVYLARYYYDTTALYFCGELTVEDYNESHPDLRLWLYKSAKEISSDDNSNSDVAEKRALFDILFEGIDVDYSKYSRDSFEVLLRALEDGVAVYENPDSKDADYTAATQRIRDAINGLVIDVKKIEGTLFKYGYDNSTGTPDYTDGGILINKVSIAKMKNAILSDANLVNQIKQIIGYDDPSMGWTGTYADDAFNTAVESYARIYSLLFTGKAVANIENNNGSFTTWPAINETKNPPGTLWNLWTKDNTHGENDTMIPEMDGTLTPVHDGASVQGLAGLTLEKGVITSHALYSDPLSYSNNGPTDKYGQEPYDVDLHYISVYNGSDYKYIYLEYLSGISVYFPDVFTRESLDANGNVTDATSGKFAKYYWDAQFPIFISTDQYGVNTYHFDSKDKSYLVQSEFDDENHTVDIDLNEVGDWNISGTTAQSGFFPFNYQQGTTSYYGENAIYHYGFTFEHNFYIPKGGKHLNGEDVIFNFSGDDDVYVYIDGVLVLDNGGLHGAREVTINFTDCTINYQYAMDVEDGKLKADGVEYGTTYSYNEYFKNPDSCDYSPDTIAALEKLHEIIYDGQVHTLNFFYLERGSSDSNCRMSFNLSETSEEVRIIDQELTLDYGLPVEYNIQDNNDISEAAIENGVQIEYLGICAVNEDVSSTYTFELPEIIVPFEEGITYDVDGMKYGSCTIDKEGNVKYTLNSMSMTDSDHFYVCAKITGDPTYADSVVYYQIERTTFIPATSIYYEDTYASITYTDGEVPSDYDNTVNKYGIWQEYGEQLTTLKQSADLTDSEANPYGYETNYMSFADYSGGSIHYVDVSTKNNPNKKYSGGDGGEWPTVDFTFTGTGFDLISITDNTTGAFSVAVKDLATGKTIRNTVVDTFYGYNYGRIFADADGKPTLDTSLTPMYRSDDGTCTSSKRYYDENGEITDVPHYYDEFDNVVESETLNPAYAYAYGWVIADDGTTETLYQIPVIKITGLEYGNYEVTITPTFTSAFGHASVDSDNNKYYRVYFDAVKIYSPAGVGDEIADKVVKDAYATDDELYPDYIELKDMLIGAESLSESEGQGIIFIDGIAALDNDLEKYKNAGPNNELYLAKDQAVAFEIWATSVPTDIQLGAKLACGMPRLTISYAADTTPIDISTAHDTFYSLNTVLPYDAKLTWHLVTGADGNRYYTTGTVVIQNTGDEDSVLSVTNLKWTFSQYGGMGHFRIPDALENEEITVAATSDTPMVAYSLMRMRTADLSIEQPEEPEVITNEDGSSLVTIKLNTSSDVDSLVVLDCNGSEVTPDSIEKTVAELDGREVTEWLVTLSESEAGVHNFTVVGVYENGYVDYSEAVTVTVVIESTPEADEPEEEQPEEDDGEDESESSILDTLIGFYLRIIEFFRALFALLGVNI